MAAASAYYKALANARFDDAKIVGFTGATNHASSFPFDAKLLLKLVQKASLKVLDSDNILIEHSQQEVLCFAKAAT